MRLELETDSLDQAWLLLHAGALVLIEEHLDLVVVLLEHTHSIHWLLPDTKFTNKMHSGLPGRSPFG
jgi:hypothetical protein